MTDELNTTEIKNSLTSLKHWQRLVFMLLFGLMLHAASIAMWVLVAVQFIFTLITGSDNRNLRSLGKSMTIFISQALEYLTYNTEQKPFPFADWPDGGCSTPDEKSLTTPDQNNQPEQHP